MHLHVGPLSISHLVYFIELYSYIYMCVLYVVFVS